MEWDQLLYIAIFIIFSVLSGSRANKKKREAEQQQPHEEPSLEDEIRRMAEKMMGKKEEQPAPKPVEKPAETFNTLRDEQRSSPYETFDNDKGDEKYEKYSRFPDTKRVDYSEQDIKRVEQQHERQRNPEYISNTSNYDNESIESFKKGKEKHTLMKEKTDKSPLEVRLEERGFFDDFDPRKAIIYGEIFKRPEY